MAIATTTTDFRTHTMPNIYVSLSGVQTIPVEGKDNQWDIITIYLEYCTLLTSVKA